MERTLSQEERLRRAEEIYYRRQSGLNAPRTATVNITPRKNYRLLKKVIVQIIICVGIYSVIYKLQSNTDSFSTDSINYLKGTIAYDVDINKAFEEVKKQIETFNLLNNEGKKEENSESENIVDENVELTNWLQEATLSASERIIENMANPTETTEVAETTETIETEADSSVSQMEKDAEYIKNNFSMIKPVEGTVTSRFGPRNPTTATVPKYHTGIDIGVVEGTVIIASMEGTVELVSSVGDYGNHVKITNGDVATIYAHCKTIYVKEGDKIVQGQQIGESGSTGNVTGPHLHFEIRRNNEYVDPDLILNF